MSSVESSDVHCFCKKPAKTYSNKKGKTFVRCGVTLDYGKIGKKLKKLKTKAQQRRALETMKLGCNMNLSLEDAQQLDSSHEWRFKAFPKCEHDLYAKLAISHSKKNDGKVFWTCPVQYPDIDCGFFQWAANEEESESSSSSEDEVITPKPKRKSKNNSKGERKCESSHEKTGSESESEDEYPPMKRRSSTRKSKKRQA